MSKSETTYTYDQREESIRTLELKYANKIKKIQAQHRVEIRDSLDKQRSELLKDIADLDKADQLK